MKIHPTTVGCIYAVITPVDCTITTSDEIVICTCTAGRQTIFVAQTSEVIASCDEAKITESFKGASLSVQEGGGIKIVHAYDPNSSLPISGAGVASAGFAALNDSNIFTQPQTVEFAFVQSNNMSPGSAPLTVINTLNTNSTVEIFKGIAKAFSKYYRVSYYRAADSSFFKTNAKQLCFSTENGNRIVFRLVDGGITYDKEIVWDGKNLNIEGGLIAQGAAALNGLSMEAYPAGSIAWCFSDDGIPGYLPCYGLESERTVSRSTYSNLASLLGIPADDSTFILPYLPAEQLGAYTRYPYIKY